MCRFDLNGDGVIEPAELRRAILTLGLVPFGGDPAAVVEDLLASLQVQAEENITFDHFQVRTQFHAFMQKSKVRYADVAHIS